MQALQERAIRCPYCDEQQEVLLDCSVAHQQYIEDCQVCCRPINFSVAVDYDGELSLQVSHENDG